MAHADTHSKFKRPQPPRSVVRLTPRHEMPEQGTVAWFDENRGYGFITPDRGGDDVFVHLRVVRLYRVNPAHLQMGTVVRFKQERQESRPRMEATAIAVEFSKEG